MGNRFGTLFKITTFGESHGHSVGVVIDGCPAGVKLSLAEIQASLERRRPGQSKLTTPRNELDRVQIVSGVEEFVTLGSPVTLIVKNQDKKPTDYDGMQSVFRPSHADFTTQAKYGLRAKSGGGRSSARETIGRVAAASVAAQMLEQMGARLEIRAWVHAVKDIQIRDTRTYSREDIEASLVRCPEPSTSDAMIALIEEMKKQGDSVGGVIACEILGCPVGLGEPVFDKLEACLAQAVLSLPASKSFEIGSGIAGTKLTGSEHNDLFTPGAGGPKTLTNHSGGVQGGISNGQPICFRVGFKPTSTIAKPQDTVNEANEPVKLEGKGRHDPCVLPRAVPIVEAMATLVIADLFLRNQTAKF